MKIFTVYIWILEKQGGTCARFNLKPWLEAKVINKMIRIAGFAKITEESTELIKKDAIKFEHEELPDWHPNPPKEEYSYDDIAVEDPTMFGVGDTISVSPSSIYYEEMCLWSHETARGCYAYMEPPMKEMIE